MQRGSRAADLGTGCTLQRVGILFDRLSVEVFGGAEARWRLEGWLFKFERREQGLVVCFFRRRCGKIEFWIRKLLIYAGSQFNPSIFLGHGVFFKQELANSTRSSWPRTSSAQAPLRPTCAPRTVQWR